MISFDQTEQLRDWNYDFNKSRSAEAFSGGNFQIAYDYLGENIIWNIVGDKILSGKSAVVKFCDQTAEYFDTVTTEFNFANTIAENDRFVINGTAKFTSKEGETMNLSSCDVYRFADGKLQDIASYCIVLKDKEN